MKINQQYSHPQAVRLAILLIIRVILNYFLPFKPHKMHKGKKIKTKGAKTRSKVCHLTSSWSLQFTLFPYVNISYFSLTDCCLRDVCFLLLTRHELCCSISISVAKHQVATSKRCSVSPWTNLELQYRVNRTGFPERVFITLGKIRC